MFFWLEGKSLHLAIKFFLDVKKERKTETFDKYEFPMISSFALFQQSLFFFSKVRMCV